MSDSVSEDHAKLPEHVFMNELVSVLEGQGRRAEEIELVKKGFVFAEAKHEGQKRKNGENYIVHPVSVAIILARIPLDTPTVIAALLHDTLEDTDATPQEVETQFGPDVLKLVEGVTKLGKIEFSSKEDRQAENFRRMFLSMADDVRVIMLKLADRLHNMRTLTFLKPEKQQKIASETIEIFAPLANRLGMGKLRAELEDISLRYLHPETYEEISTSLAETQGQREGTIQEAVEKIRDQLAQSRFDAKIYGRAKNFYSIYKKMLTQQKTLVDIHDISAIRIIVPEEKDCYEVLGVIHHVFTPIPGRFKDYIAMPKSNLYQSLHTTVIGPNGKPLEIQIRTEDMHRIAEYGIAAHWKYKESGGSVSVQSEEEQKLSWLKQMLEFKDNTGDAQEYVDSVKLDLFRDEVFVFTPKGKVVDLPKGSTPVDFAYRIHTEVGNTCTGSIVNGKIVPLTHVLKNGDIIEVMTSKKASPKLDWIKFVQTQQAKARIRQWFKKNYREEHEVQGRQLLEAELTKAHLDEVIKNGKMMEVAKELNCVSLEDLFLGVGYGELNVTRVVNRLKRDEATALLNEQRINRLNKAVNPKKSEIEGLKGMLYHLAKCCLPVPGDGIIGVVTRSRGIMVHREDCMNLNHVNPERQMNVSWEGGTEGSGGPKTKKSHAVKLEIHVLDRIGVFKDILTRIADSNTNLTDAKVRPQSDQSAIIEVTVDILDTDHLERLKHEICKISDVVNVTRFLSRPGAKGATGTED
jgi:GTP diphosphokinase / guanosine-3',5'-bis(diphosphate) 3'-diphosphatase